MDCRRIDNISQGLILCGRPCPSGIQTPLVCCGCNAKQPSTKETEREILCRSCMCGGVETRVVPYFVFSMVPAKRITSYNDTMPKKQYIDVVVARAGRGLIPACLLRP